MEAWWDGVRGLAATDAACAACAAAAAPGDKAIVLGPRSAAERAAALGAPVAGAWSAPLGMHGLWMRPLRRLVGTLGAFGRVVAWTPGASSTAAKLGLPVVDRAGGEGWPAGGMDAGDRERARAELPGVGTEDLLVGVVWDPPGAADALTANYGMGLIEGAGLLRGRPAAMVVPRGACGVERAERLSAGVRLAARLLEAPGTLEGLIAASDVVVFPPLDAARGQAGRANLRAARAWWIARATAAGRPMVLGPEDPETPGAVRLPAWGRAELGRGLREVLRNTAMEASPA